MSLRLLAPVPSSPPYSCPARARRRSPTPTTPMRRSSSATSRAALDSRSISLHSWTATRATSGTSVTAHSAAARNNSTQLPRAGALRGQAGSRHRGRRLCGEEQEHHRARRSLARLPADHPRSRRAEPQGPAGSVGPPPRSGSGSPAGGAAGRALLERARLVDAHGAEIRDRRGLRRISQPPPGEPFPRHLQTHGAGSLQAAEALAATLFTAFSMLVFTHEVVHTLGIGNEAAATCFALQLTGFMSRALGTNDAFATRLEVLLTRWYRAEQPRAWLLEPPGRDTAAGSTWSPRREAGRCLSCAEVTLEAEPAARLIAFRLLVAS